MINMQHSHVAMLEVQMHLEDLHARARKDRLAREVREPHAVRHGMGRLLIAAGSALVRQTREPACADYVPVVAR